MLPSFLDTYASGTIPSLRRILILWHDNTTSPPSDFLDSISSYPVPVIIEPRHISLNQRFHTSENVVTDCVLTIDDDMRYKPEDIEFGYQAWKELGQGRKRMVGYVAREVRDRTYILNNLETYRWVQHAVSKNMTDIRHPPAWS